MATTTTNNNHADTFEQQCGDTTSQNNKSKVKVAGKADKHPDQREAMTMRRHINRRAASSDVDKVVPSPAEEDGFSAAMLKSVDQEDFLCQALAAFDDAALAKAPQASEETAAEEARKQIAATHVLPSVERTLPIQVPFQLQHEIHQHTTLGTWVLSLERVIMGWMWMGSTGSSAPMFASTPRTGHGCSASPRALEYEREGLEADGQQSGKLCFNIRQTRQTLQTRANPYPYLQKPLPVVAGMGFHG
ncbi:uncharacterized protein LACBIDRAFT_335253 [Laccaria bicolor S238N-H82]|uniref:Predicted protein n=1 Tax=Laccaria bicolor (strain S238N-H82 / ATCC MYA-4686) TaxID=486041 RepID=B0E1T8_LACBS|nr:uncharacterized protein LACBIDRAFT_335253 [Laccaria bicolor S238N-H82]EDQ99180.1 predicted protein [Laccaria bicolor S238N-H82]|eukprot:XP_001890147.1 predicted protein [Laccaria bicolor S238N-H82]